MKRLTITAILIMLWAYPVIADENIYKWTGKDGINHFSNQKPPDGVQQYNTIKVPSDKSTSGGPAEESRPGYENMVEKAKEEIQQNEIKTKQEEAERAEKEKQQAEQDRKAQIEAKRIELQDRIDALKKRPLSRTFDTAFRNAQIDMIQKQIDELDKSQ